MIKGRNTGGENLSDVKIEDAEKPQKRKTSRNR